MKAARIAALGMLAASASIGLAGPASAEFDNGSYTNTVTESNKFEVGQTQTWNVSDCGPDCKHVEGAGSPRDYHRQGNSWTASSPQTPQMRGADYVLDNDSLAGMITYSDGSYLKYQLKKN